MQKKRTDEDIGPFLICLGTSPAGHPNSPPPRHPERWGIVALFSYRVTGFRGLLARRAEVRPSGLISPEAVSAHLVRFGPTSS